MKKFIMCTGDMAVGQIKRFQVSTYRNFLLNRWLSPKTVNLHTIALRRFLYRCFINDIPTMHYQKIELMKQKDSKITTLTEEEIELLLSIPRRLRDIAIMNILYSSGIRVSELTNLKMKDLDIRKGKMYIQGKGGSVGVAFISPRAKDALKLYLNHRLIDSEFVFISESNNNRGKKMHRNSINLLLNEYSKTADIGKKVTPHVLRHSFASHLLENGADIRVVQCLLRHKAIQSTMKYAAVSDNLLRKTHKKLYEERKVEETLMAYA